MYNLFVMVPLSQLSSLMYYVIRVDTAASPYILCISPVCKKLFMIFQDPWVQFFKSDLMYLGDEFFRTTLKSSTLKKTVKLTIACPRYTKMFDLALQRKNKMPLNKLLTIIPRARVVYKMIDS